MITQRNIISYWNLKDNILQKVYLPPCSRCCTSTPPKVEVTRSAPSPPICPPTCPPVCPPPCLPVCPPPCPPSSCFYVCTAKCSPCVPCPPPRSSYKSLCSQFINTTPFYENLLLRLMWIYHFAVPWPLKDAVLIGEWLAIILCAAAFKYNLT